MDTPRPAAEGDELTGPAEIETDTEAEAVPVDEDDDVGSGGAAMNISFCAPLAYPYRAL